MTVVVKSINYSLPLKYAMKTFFCDNTLKNVTYLIRAKIINIINHLNAVYFKILNWVVRDSEPNELAVSLRMYDKRKNLF